MYLLQCFRNQKCCQNSKCCCLSIRFISEKWTPLIAVIFTVISLKLVHIRLYTIFTLPDVMLILKHPVVLISILYLIMLPELKLIVVDDVSSLFILQTPQQLWMHCRSPCQILSVDNNIVQCILSRFSIWCLIWQALVRCRYVQTPFMFYGFIIHHFISSHHLDKVANLKQNQIYVWSIRYVSVLATVYVLSHHFSYISTHVIFSYVNITIVISDLNMGLLYFTFFTSILTFTE